MTKFKYRMQNILDIKNQMEEQAKLEFAQARMALNEEEDHLKKLNSRKRSYENEMRKLLHENLKVRKIIEARDAISKMEGMIEEQILKVRFAEKKLEEARQKMTELMQERKTHENLKEKAFDVFIKELNAGESKEIDQLTSYRFGKKINEQSETGKESEQSED